MAKRIETTRLILDPLTRDHLPGFHRIWTDPQATLWSLSGPKKSLEESEKWLAGIMNDPNNAKRLSWGVYLKTAPDSCIGIVDMGDRENKGPGQIPHDHGPIWEAAYLFLPEYWGKGYATEALKEMIEAARPIVHPCTLQAYVNPANPGSLAVARKLGFEVAEKIYKPDEPRVWIGGEWREYDVWRLTLTI